RLIETKGKGGFGTVDVAWDSRLQRRVAIKRIPLAIDETDLPGIQEARTAALLNDARIVNVLDFEVTGTEALLIMEYVDGPTLTNLLRESAELLDLDSITTIMNDVAAALEYAHENQVLHLDIKPDNILIDHKGHTKVTDFGLAELSGTAGFAEAQGGTIGYMPPEQILQGDVDARTDLWAFAVLLYQLLTGSNPFFARTTDESLARILNEPLTLPSALRPELDPAIDEVLVRALMANRLQRFASVPEFFAEVAPYLGNAQNGRRALKRRVNERDLDEVEFGDEWHRDDSLAEQPDEDVPAAVPLWDRLPIRLRGVLERLVAALACGSFALSGLSGFGLPAPSDALAGAVAQVSPEMFAQSNTQFIVFAGIVVLIAFGAFLVPQLGSVLASTAFFAGIIAGGALVVGLVLDVLLIAWWLFVGRRGRADSNVVMLTPLLGTLWLGFAAPLLAGFFLPWRRALPAAVAQAVILIALVTLTQGSDLAHTSLFLVPQDALVPPQVLAYLAHPQTWATLIAFVLAALVMAALAARGTTPSTLLGALLGIVVLTLPRVLMPLLIESDIWLTDIAVDGVGLTLSFILVLILSLMGVPADNPQVEEV
ncbi:MAG: serine/threonine protein kinase, partial [Coriobacteriales bacterium]|nr:serine/threonine protein kinase [Coriobacteriales bacterium]